MPKMLLKSWTFVQVVALLMAVAVFIIAKAENAHGADRDFGQRFSTVANGDIAMTGNTSMTCPASAACTSARNGTATGNAASNNAYAMTYVDVDADASTFSSSRSNLSLPAGATVLFAGLYWGGESTAADALRGAVKLDTPAAGSYVDLTATVLDSATADPTQYQGFVDVTSLVSAGGNGTYTAANVNGTSTSANKYAGWSIVVAYSLPSATRNHLKVYDGLQRVSTENPTESVAIPGITTPATGTIPASLGIIAYDGDRGIIGGSATLNTTAIFDAQNPANNVFNSTITRGGSHFTAKDPNYVNQLGYDADIFTTSGALAAGSTSAMVTLTTAAGDYYLPGVVTLVNPPETVAPETMIDSGPSGLTNDNTPTWAFTSTEAGSTFQCRIDGGTWNACSSPFTPATLTDGAHTFDVRAIDPQLNVDASPASRSITVDATGPDTTISSGPTGATNDNTPTWAFSSSEAGSTFQCRIDGGSWNACTSPVTGGTLADGAHSFDVRAIDAAGNADATPAARSITVDTAAPDTSVTSGPSGFTNDSTPTWAFTSTEAGSTFQCRIDGGAWSACTSPFTPAALTDGAHTFDVRSIDPAGNVDASPASRSITVDTAAPNTTVDSGPTGLTGDSTPTWAFSSEPGATFECRVDAGAWSACTSPFTAATLADGSRTFDVRATDPAGNTDASPASRSINVDTVAPGLVDIADSDPDSPANDTSPKIKGSAEAGSTVRLYTNATCSSAIAASGSAAAFGSPGLTVTVLADSTTTFWATATDAAGNASACSTSSLTYRTDSAAPDTTIDSGPSGAIADSTPTWEFSSDEPGSSFECRIDAGPWASCSSPHTPAQLAEGAYTFEVRATDAAGNVDATPASRSVNVDATAPDTTIDSGPEGLTLDSTPTFGFSSSEPGSSFECRVDNGAWNSCTSAETTGELADGEHTFDVRATDPVGNVDATPASRTITVDTTAPDTTIDSGPSGVTSDPTPSFEFSSDEPGSSFECRLDGGAWEACDSPGTTPALADGPHSFEVRAVDAAGNADPTPAQRNLIIDATSPQTTIDSGPNGQIADPTPTFVFTSSEAGSSFECRIDLGPWTACDTPYTSAPLPDGAHAFEVRATDAGGNVDPTPARLEFTLSTVVAPPPPPPAPTDPPAGSLLTANSCQQLAPGPRGIKRRVPGVGRVFVKLASDGSILGASPLQVTTRAPRNRTRSVRYTLDGVRLRGTKRARSWSQSIAPALLSGVSQHTLTVRVSGRGGGARKAVAKRFDLRFSTLLCNAVFTAQQKRRGRTSELALRIDTRSPARNVVYSVPRKLRPRAKTGAVAGSLMVQSPSGPVVYPLTFGPGGTLTGTTPPLSVAMAGGQITVSGLPEGTGIVVLTLKSKRPKNAKPSRKKLVKLSARVTAEADYPLVTKLRTKR